MRSFQDPLAVILAVLLAGCIVASYLTRDAASNRPGAKQLAASTASLLGVWTDDAAS